MTPRLPGEPRVAIAILRWILPPTPVSRSILGDLVQAWQQRPSGLRRVLWCWWVVADIGIRYLPSRLLGYNEVSSDRAAGRGRLLEGLVADVRHALRLGRRHPGPVVAAIFNLGLGVGVAGAAFAVVNGSYLRMYLAADAAIVDVWRSHARGAAKAWPEAEATQLRRASTLVTLEPWATATLQLDQPGSGSPLQAQFVTGTHLATFRAVPIVGRLIDDDGLKAFPVVVLSHRVWSLHFGRDSSIVGRTVQLAGQPVRVVGIVSKDFVDPGADSADAWLPIGSAEAFPEVRSSGRVDRLFLTGRLKPGVSTRDAEAELSRLALAGGATAERPAAGVQIGPVVGEESRRLFLQVIGGVITICLLIILLACTNASNVLLTGVAVRRREIAIRLSLGASRSRIRRQLLVECILLCTAAGIAGAAAAAWLASPLATSVGFDAINTDMDWRVALFMCAAVAVSVIVSAVAPARAAEQAEAAPSIRGLAGWVTEAVPRERGWAVILGVQAAVSIVLVVTGTLLVRTLVGLAWKDMGFDADRLVYVSLDVSPTERNELLARDYWEMAAPRAWALAGVEHVAFGTYAPFSITLGDPDSVVFGETDPAYFETMGLRLLRGRTYSAEELATRRPVAVINRTLARRYWGAQDPIGATLERVNRKLAAFQVIGVVEDTAMRVHDDPTPIVYTPLSSFASATMVVRTAEPSLTIPAIRAALPAPEGGRAPRVFAVSEIVSRGLQRPRRHATLAAGLAIFALVISAGGLAGVTAFQVRSRRREIGIRIAIGANRSDVVRLFVWRILRPVVIGLAIGLCLVLTVARIIAGVLYGISPRDPLATMSAATLLIAIALGTTWLAAWRSVRVNPSASLRAE